MTESDTVVRLVVSNPDDHSEIYVLHVDRGRAQPMWFWLVGPFPDEFDAIVWAKAHEDALALSRNWHIVRGNPGQSLIVMSPAEADTP